MQKFGKQWLLGLPDRATELDDGGVYHELNASATEMVQPHQTGLAGEQLDGLYYRLYKSEPPSTDAPVYSSVRAYLRQSGIGAEWPETRPAEPIRAEDPTSDP